jgi:hypothetical protein
VVLVIHVYLRVACVCFTASQHLGLKALAVLHHLSERRRALLLLAQALLLLPLSRCLHGFCHVDLLPC